MRVTVRYIIGYILGFTIFILLIPFGLYELSKINCFLSDRVISNSTILRYIFSIVFFLIGVFFALWSNIFLFFIGKGGPADGFGIAISPRTKKLVTTGPYRYSRNPMVFGAFMIYLSIVIFLNSIIVLFCLLIFFTMGIIYLKLSEEKRLLRDFGDEYLHYKKRVSMIFPLRFLK